MLTAACRDGAAWQERYPRAEPLLVCVNTSPRQLANAAFPARVADIMGRHGLAPGSLALEITESVLMEEAHAPVTVLASLREYGLRLMLDDFGTGYSSLAYLKRFPLDVLKIDRSFVAGLGRDEEDSAIVAAIVQMAQTLGLTVIAEGVERPEQLERLRELGCDRAQGRLIAEPMPAARVDAADGVGDRLMRVFDGHNDVLSKRVADGHARASWTATATATSTCRARRRAGSPAAASPCSPAARRTTAYDSGAYYAAVDPERARAEALAQVAFLLRLERESGGRLRVARTAAELDGDGRRRRPARRGRRADRDRARRAARAPRRGPALARASSGAGRTRSRPACRSRSPARPTRARG